MTVERPDHHPEPVPYTDCGSHEGWAHDCPDPIHHMLTQEG